MNKPRTVTLELLRHGPPHNQLLSPLTQYLALCGNHSAVTLTMPFEHNQLRIRLNALLYKDDPETVELQLKDTAQIMGEILAKVPGHDEIGNDRDDDPENQCADESHVSLPESRGRGRDARMLLRGTHRCSASVATVDACVAAAQWRA